MGFVVLGVLLCAMKLFDLGPPAAWSWWINLLPFALAVAWWSWSDASGRTRRLAMDKIEDKKAERRRKALVQLGIDPRKHDKQAKTTAAYQAALDRQAAQLESKRDVQRRKNRDSVINSRIDLRGDSRIDPPDGSPPARPPR